MVSVCRTKQPIALGDAERRDDHTLRNNRRRRKDTWHRNAIQPPFEGRQRRVTTANADFPLFFLLRFLP